MFGIRLRGAARDARNSTGQEGSNGSPGGRTNPPRRSEELGFLTGGEEEEFGPGAARISCRRASSSSSRRRRETSGTRGAREENGCGGRRWRRRRRRRRRRGGEPEPKLVGWRTAGRDDTSQRVGPPCNITTVLLDLTGLYFDCLCFGPYWREEQRSRVGRRGGGGFLWKGGTVWASARSFGASDFSPWVGPQRPSTPRTVAEQPTWERINPLLYFILFLVILVLVYIIILTFFSHKTFLH